MLTAEVMDEALSATTQLILSTRNVNKNDFDVFFLI